MGQHRALGQPGGAAGVLQHRNRGLRVDRHGCKPAVIAHQALVMNDAGALLDPADLLALHQREQQVLREGQHAGHRADHDPLQTGLAQQRLRLVIDHRQVQRHHHPGAAVIDLMLDFARGVERIEVHDRGADGQRRIVIDDRIRGIGQEQPHPIALFDADLLQTLGRLGNQPPDLLIGHDLAQEIDRRPIAIGCDRMIHQRGQRRRRKCLTPVDIRRISLQPHRSDRVGLHLGTHHLCHRSSQTLSWPVIRLTGPCPATASGGATAPCLMSRPPTAWRYATDVSVYVNPPVDYPKTRVRDQPLP